MAMPLRRPRPGAFTLVELLVVIAIISILAAMLLPALSGAVNMARKAHCASNFHQILTASFVYAQDWSGRLPRLNQGSYCCLGIAGPTLESDIPTDAGAIFTDEYLDSPWSYDAGVGRMRVPPIYCCPGWPANRLTPHVNLPPSYGPMVRLGSRSRRGTIVGFASFLGQDSGTANHGVVRAAHVPLGILRAPEEEVLVLDAIMQVPNENMPTPDSKWTIPHGSSTVPEGSNQGYSDGSVRWISAFQFNVRYKPERGHERYVSNPLCLDKDKAVFNYGGYGFSKRLNKTRLGHINDGDFAEVPKNYFGYSKYHFPNYSPYFY